MVIRRRESRSVYSAEASECVTLDLGLEGFRECPQIGPSTCAFAIPFGYGFLCEKPKHLVVPRRRRAKSPAQSVASTGRTG